MKTIVFQGYLKKLYPEGIKVEAESAYEAVSLLQFYPGFKLGDGVIHKVWLPGFRTLDAAQAKSFTEVIEVVPMDLVTNPEEFTGAGNKALAWVEIIVGAIVMFYSYGQYPQLFAAGMGLALSGVLGLMMPAPPKDNGSGNRSNYLSANKNTVAIGTVIPLGFGRRKVFGHYLSFNVTALNAPPTIPTPDGTSSGSGDATTPITYDGDWVQYNQNHG